MSAMREKLEEAWLPLHPKPELPYEATREQHHAWLEASTAYWQKRDRWLALLNAEAWLDAAMMLYEPGHEFMLSWSRMSVDMGGNNWKASVNRQRAAGTTPAEALLAAIEKARTV